MFSQSNPEFIPKRDLASPAAAGNSSATATVLAKALNFVSGADGTKGVRLPTTNLTNPVNRDAGLEIVVVNTNGVSALKVYPGTGGQINAAGADVALSVAAGKSVILRSTGTADTWWAQAGA